MKRIVLEIVGIERARYAAPVARRAAEPAQAHGIERIIVETYDLAVCQLLCVALIVELSAFEQSDVPALRGQFACERYSRRSGPANANIENGVPEPVVLPLLGI